MNKPMRKAVIPVAGLGTRMLPATKAIPKELLPVYDRPIIEHVVKEAIAAGTTEIILVTRSAKRRSRIILMRTLSLSTGLRRRAKKLFWVRLKTSYPVMSQ